MATWRNVSVHIGAAQALLGLVPGRQTQSDSDCFALALHPGSAAPDDEFLHFGYVAPALNVPSEAMLLMGTSCHSGRRGMYARSMRFARSAGCALRRVLRWRYDKSR